VNERNNEEEQARDREDAARERLEAEFGPGEGAGEAPAEGGGGGNSNQGENILDTNLVPNPDAPPDVRVLTGYAGRSPRADHIRLWANLEANHFLEIPRKDIHHQIDLPAEEGLDGLVRRKLWVYLGARILRVTRESLTLQRRFLGGRPASQGAAPVNVHCSCGATHQPGCPTVQAPTAWSAPGYVDDPFFDFSSRAPC
jgi:hypothetical protein